MTGLINSSFKAPSVFILLGNLEARTGTWEMGISITKINLLRYFQYFLSPYLKLNNLKLPQELMQLK